jgi:hypothetical protein
VLGQVPTGQEAAVDLGVQGLDASVEHLGEPGDVGDLLDLDAVLGEELVGSAGGDDLDTERFQFLRKINDSRLV